MTTKTLVLTALISTSLLSCSKQTTPAGDIGAGAVVANGQERGNGTDYRSLEDRSAWFVDANRVFTYCAKIDPAFGVAEDKSLAIISDALQNWADYHSERSWHKTLATKSRFEPSCSDSTDLVFLLGTKLPKGEASDQHVGLAVKKAYDKKAGWGQGYVWIAAEGSVPAEGEDGPYPNWQETDSLKAVLLHEIGHVYGVDHVEGTIMRADASEYGFGVDPSELPIQIDGDNILVLPSAGIVGSLGVPESSLDGMGPFQGGDVEQNFELLTGRKPVGKVIATLHITGTRLDRLQFRDDQSDYNFALNEFESEIPNWVGSSWAAFLTAKEENGSVYYRADSTGRSARDVWFTDAKLTKRVATLYQNVDSGFSLHDESKKESAFFTTLGATLKMHDVSGPKFLFTWKTKLAGGTDRP